MKTAKEKYYSERHALACKIIELHRHRAFDDHASTVKRLYERLDARAKRVVDLQLEAEAAEAAWQYERKAEEVQRLKAHMAFLEKAASEEESREAALDDAYDVIQELNEELESKHSSHREDGGRSEIREGREGKVLPLSPQRLAQRPESMSCA